MAETHACFVPVSSPVQQSSGPNIIAIPPLAQFDVNGVLAAINALIQVVNNLGGNVPFGSSASLPGGGIGRGFGGGNSAHSKKSKQKPKKEKDKKKQQPKPKKSKDPLQPPDKQDNKDNNRKNSKGKGGSGSGDYREDKSRRRTSKHKISNPKDKSQFIEIELIDSFTFVSRSTGDSFTWSR